jgi:outer membrane protein assembly factor BamD (BamD/ComL family)
VKQFVASTLLISGLSILVLAGSGCQSMGWESSSNPLQGLLGKQKEPDDELYEDSRYDMLGESNPERLLMQDLAPGRIATTISTRLSGKQDPVKAETSFREGHEFYSQAIAAREANVDSPEAVKLFREASLKFQIAADNMRDSALEQDALFMQGESSFFANDYVLANRAYEILLDRYSGSAKLDLVESRRFEIAQYWLSLKRSGAGMAIGNAARPMTGLDKEARRILHRIRLDDPTGKLADDATLALGNAFMEAGLYSDAADTYEDLRRTFPGSTHLYLAHRFEIQARLAAYRGPNYDGTDLIKAEKVMTSMLRQFPAETRGDQELLAEDGSKIRHMLAEREWTLGSYYESRGENRAASHHYSLVAQKYDDTEFSAEARDRIAALGGLPPVPEPRAQWLADLFPVKERNKPLIATGDRESIIR